MPVYVGTGGAFRNSLPPSIAIGGTFRKVKQGWAAYGGTFRPLWNTIEYPLMQAGMVHWKGRFQNWALWGGTLQYRYFNVPDRQSNVTGIQIEVSVAIPQGGFGGLFSVGFDRPPNGVWYGPAWGGISPMMPCLFTPNQEIRVWCAGIVGGDDGDCCVLNWVRIVNMTFD